jgi:hypothetical protein
VCVEVLDLEISLVRFAGARGDVQIFAQSVASWSGGDAPALMEAHLLVRLAVGDRPVTDAGGVASLPPFVLESEDDRHERFLGWFPSGRVSVREDEAFILHDIKIDAAVRHLGTIRAAHHDEARSAGAQIGFGVRGSSTVAA